MRISLLKKISSGLLVLFLITGCAYSHIQRPLDTQYQNTDLGNKVGRSSSYSLLWLFAWGDAGSRAAAENGNITVIRHADVEVVFVLFGLYARVTTVVYGD